MKKLVKLGDSVGVLGVMEYSRIPCSNGLVLPEKIYFSPKEGGIVCQKCFKKDAKSRVKEISIDTIKVLRIFFERGWLFFKKVKISPQVQKELGMVSECFLSHIKKSIS